MTYYLGYTPEDSTDDNRGYVLFDIEYYMKQSDADAEMWYSEIHCLPCVEGLTRFLKDKNWDFNYEQFIRDANKIQEVRGFLYEQHNNKPKSMEEASHFHYHTFRDEIESMFKTFINKYGLWINKD